MVEPFIIVQSHLWVTAKPCMDRRLRLWTDKMVCSRDMQHEWMGNRMALTEHLINHDAIIANGCTDIGTRRCHIGQSSTQALADTAHMLNGGMG